MESANLIHVELTQTGKHYYFGSMKAIYGVLSVDDVGISYNTLRSHYSPKEDFPYKNEKCIIRKGSIVRTSKNA